MVLQNISNEELISRMQRLVRTERKVMHLVLIHIAEIESRKLYADLGFDGIYSYLTKGLGYSDASAFRRLQSARLLKQFPSVAEKVEEGSLNLSQLTQVQKCLKESTKNGESISTERTLEVLSKLENKNSFETQKTLALEMNLPIEMHEKIKPQKDESIRLEITLTKEKFAELEQAKNLLSHICPEGSWAEVISTLAAQFNKKKLEGRTKLTQPVAAAEMKVDHSKMIPVKSTKDGDATIVGLHHANSTPHTARKREYISLHTKRILLKKAQNCCEYRDPKTNTKCGSQYQLEIDHRQPFALGGSNKPENLRILCRTHNALAARNMGLLKRSQDKAL